MCQLKRYNLCPTEVWDIKVFGCQMEHGHKGGVLSPET